MNPRVVVWFSCGAASACAAKLALEKYGRDRVVVVYCDTMSTEHPDNARFFEQVGKWLGVEIRRLKSEDYADVDDVFEQTRYMAGIAGARCTVEMKKNPRYAFQRDDDIHIFGFTADEQRRIDRFEENNPELATDWILRDQGVEKDDCYAMIEEAGIPLPAMYQLGYNNNNCLGCVKATSARYWNMIRRDFPDVFERRARQSRELGVRLTRVKGKRVFIDELPEDYLPAEDLEDISCGPECSYEPFDYDPDAPQPEPEVTVVLPTIDTATAIDHGNRAHSRLGASSAHRWMNCPGSVALSQGIPDSPSEHAKEGKLAHELAEAMLRGDPRTINFVRDAIRAAGYDVGPMSRNVNVYTDYVRSLEGAKFYEERVPLEKLSPPVDMFGTIDAMIWNAGTGHLEIVDLKYGRGVMVDPTGNPQGLYYLLGGILLLGVKPKTMRITIVQPRIEHEDGTVRSWDPTWEEVKAFKAELMEKAAETMADDPPLVVGDHCKWCRAKAVCPAQRSHAMELAQVEFDTEREPLLPAPAGLDPEHVSLILERASLVEDWLNAVREYAHERLEAGEEVPGWKLVEGRRSRGWRDKEEAEAWLRQRYKVGEIFTQKLISPYQAEKLVKDRPRLEIPEEMILVSNGKPKLAPADSPKPALTSGTEFPTEESN